MTKVNFSAALGALRSIVGAEWVFADETAITPYKDAMIPDVGGKHVPIGAVAPATVEQVQQIVEVANRYKMPSGRFRPARIHGKFRDVDWRRSARYPGRVLWFN
jgi:hypothetical protein